MPNKRADRLAAMAAADAATAGNLAIVSTAGGALQSSRFDVLMGALGRLSRVYHISDPRFGASESNTGAQNLAAIQACIDAAPDGASIEFDGLTLPIAGTLLVDHPCNIDWFGATLTQQTSNTTLFSVTSSGVKFRGDRAGMMQGPQFATEQQSEIAIKVEGTDSSNYLDGFEFDGGIIERWGGYGLRLKYVENFNVHHFQINDIWYTGIGGVSVQDGTVTSGNIDTVVGTPNAYGMFFSRTNSDSLVTEPRSKNISVSNVTVRDVDAWEGFDTHGGQGITFTNCKAISCRRGFVITSADNASNVETYAPHDCHIIGCIADADVTDGSASYGMVITGASGSTGSPVELAQGCSIIGGTVRWHGPQSNSIAGAVYCHDTRGLKIVAPALIEPSPHGIYLGNDNYDFNISGVTVVDWWSTAVANVAAINVASNYNTGMISGCRAGTGSKVATNLRVWGIRVGASLTNSSVILGENSMEAAATPYSVATAAAVVSGTRASPLVIGASGTALTQVVVYTPTLTPTAVSAASAPEQTFTVTGLATTDKVIVNPPASLGAVGINARVSASNTLALRFVNPTAGSITPVSGTYTVIAFRS